MKRQLNIFDGLFLMALYFKITNTGLVLCWAAVFIPYYTEAALGVITAYSRLFGWGDRIKYWFWKWAMDRGVKRAGEKAREYMKAAEEKGRLQALKNKTNNQ